MISPKAASPYIINFGGGKGEGEEPANATGRDVNKTSDGRGQHVEEMSTAVHALPVVSVSIETALSVPGLIQQPNKPISLSCYHPGRTPRLLASASTGATRPGRRPTPHHRFPDAHGSSA